MTLTELARELAKHIAQGKGDWQIAVHQWNHGLQEVTAVETREGLQTVELYSGTVSIKPEQDDLLGADDDIDDLI